MLGYLGLLRNLFGVFFVAARVFSIIDAAFHMNASA